MTGHARHRVAGSHEGAPAHRGRREKGRHAVKPLGGTVRAGATALRRRRRACDFGFPPVAFPGARAAALTTRLRAGRRGVPPVDPLAASRLGDREQA